MQRWTMVLTVSIGVLPGATASAKPDETLTVQVLAVNQAKVPDDVVRKAEQHATRIFSAAGIALVWTNTRASEPYYQTAAHVRIVIVPDSRIDRDRRKLAIAYSGDLAAYGFYKRIVGLAEHGGADVAALLGHVIAHELGHLLLPYNAHASRGIMRASWDRAQLDDMQKEVLTFDPEQTELIRTRVRAMPTNESRRHWYAEPLFG